MGRWAVLNADVLDTMGPEHAVSDMEGGYFIGFGWDRVNFLLSS